LRSFSDHASCAFLFGNGANIAARLDSWAIPGGIMVSRMARDHSKPNISIKYQELGDGPRRMRSAPI